MERLLIALVVWVVQQLLRLILLALTGKWRTLQEWVEQAKQRAPAGRVGVAVKRTRAGGAPADLEQRLKRSKAAQRGRASEAAAFPFEFAPELTESEPSSELDEPEPASEAEALAIASARARRRAELQARRAAKLVTAAPPKRSLKQALRDRTTLRQALALGAALGPRR